MNFKNSFYFIRHGETRYNEQKRFQGSIDEPLNKRGIEQAYLAAQRIKNSNLPIDLIISSQLKRAYKTAEIISEELNTPLLVNPSIAEKNYGVLEGTYIADLQKNITANPTATIDPTGLPELEGSESYAYFQQRVKNAIGETLMEHVDKKVLFVAHTTVFATLYHNLTGKIMKPDNGIPFLFENIDNSWKIKEVTSAKQKT